MDAAVLQAATERVRDWWHDGVVHGAVLAVAGHGGDVAVVAEGRTTIDEPLEPHHRFLLTSVTKAITATQVLTLADRGLVDLRAPIAAYVPSFVGDGKERVQVWHVLSHCSGISLRGNVAEGPPTHMTADQLRRFAIETPLSRPPATDAEYSSPGMWVLAELIQQVTGLDHARHLEGLLEPLGLSTIGYEPGDDPGPHYVPPYAERNSHLAEQVRRLAYPAGGLIATAGDLARFGAAVAASRAGGLEALLSPSMLDAATRVWSSGTWPDGRPQVWGLGWELQGPGDGWGTPTMFHFGASGTGLWVDVDRGLAFAMLTADWYLPRRRFGELANAFTGALTRHFPIRTPPANPTKDRT